MPKKPKKKDNPCEGCKGLCCRHVALEIDEPETAGDFDDIRWYIAHKNVHVFIEEGDWFVCFDTKCDFLDKNNLCTMYSKRPRICRQYDAENCEFHGDGDSYDMVFRKPEDIEVYAKQYLRKKYDKKKKKGKRKK